MKTIAKLQIIAIAGILCAASSASAQIYTSSDRWASYTQGDWTIYNNVWGNKKPGTQTLYVDSINSWYVNTKQDRGGVKSYPNTSVSPNTPLAQMRSATATYNTTSPAPTTGHWWNWTFDVWSDASDEVMIFTSWYPAGPGGGWGQQVASNVTIGGRLYASVWRANPGWNVLQFFPAVQSTSGTVDVLAVWNWAASQGLLNSTFFETMQFGVEVTSTKNTWQIFSLDWYSASWSSTSGGSGI